MSGRSPSEAVRNFIASLQRTVSCISGTALLRPSEGGYAAGDGHSLFLDGGSPVALSMVALRDDDPEPLQLSASLMYDVVQTEDSDRGPWKVRTGGYTYQVMTSLDEEVLLYHWHPWTAVATPHGHVGQSEFLGSARLSRKHHIPTGRVALEQLVKFLLDELRVAPARADHAKVLKKELDRFKQWQTWH